MILRWIAIVMIVSAITRAFLLDYPVIVVVPIAMVLSFAVISLSSNKINSESEILDDDNI